MLSGNDVPSVHSPENITVKEADLKRASSKGSGIKLNLKCSPIVRAADFQTRIRLPWHIFTVRLPVTKLYTVPRPMENAFAFWFDLEFSYAKFSRYSTVVVSWRVGWYINMNVLGRKCQVNNE
ncbi:hypothetical protein M404DRAFT_882101 [Pisolithus tinctorius Marx 270]|uniref:Uncharacterized protein n=1 Tax=Pisolithus tinctorius Marx 270 TaxID=870435 RepID=A0A0C3PPS5_PISTI|nr:hypothetical protein M404DRAFT_882101 [Pisolithus tinctorius Marx 270]